MKGLKHCPKQELHSIFNSSRGLSNRRCAHMGIDRTPTVQFGFNPIVECTHGKMRASCPHFPVWGNPNRLIFIVIRAFSHSVSGAREENGEGGRGGGEEEVVVE